MAASVTLRPLYYPKAIQEQQTRIQLNMVQVKMQGLSDVVSNTASRGRPRRVLRVSTPDRKSTRLNSSHQIISYAVFCLKKKHTPCRNDQLMSRRKDDVPRTARTVLLRIGVG